MADRRVVFVTRVLTHYRVPFHEGMRARLAEDGIRYELIYGDGRAAEKTKGDLAHLEWGTRTGVRYFGTDEKLSWQGGLGRLAGADLVIVGHENALLANYALLAWQVLGGPRTAFFGHGRGFQAAARDGAAERWKRMMARQAHWYFAYTEAGRASVEAAGLPSERISVVNNAVDVSDIGRSLASIGAAERDRLRRDLVGGSQHVGVFVGGIYRQKRIDFLLAAAGRIRSVVPDFHLLMIGDGPAAGEMREAAGARPWLHMLGPRFGRDKSLVLSLGSVMLMPGLVGLAVLDAFAYGTPMVTTRLAWHSPEVDYLRDGVNGVMVENSESVDDYARAVVRVLLDEDHRAHLQAGGRAALECYSIENMVERFASGILLALRT